MSQDSSCKLGTLSDMGRPDVFRITCKNEQPLSHLYVYRYLFLDSQSSLVCTEYEKSRCRCNTNTFR